MVRFSHDAESYTANQIRGSKIVVKSQTRKLLWKRLPDGYWIFNISKKKKKEKEKTNLTQLTEKATSWMELAIPYFTALHVENQSKWFWNQYLVFF